MHLPRRVWSASAMNASSLYLKKEKKKKKKDSLHEKMVLVDRTDSFAQSRGS